MRILSVLPSPAAGGAEMLVRNLCADFVQRGHECALLFMSSAAGVGNPPKFEREFLAGIKASGIAYRLMGPKSFRNPLRAARELRRAVREFHPDILHAHIGRGMLARSLAGVRVRTVFTHHNISEDFPPLLFRLFDRFADRYVAIGRATQTYLERRVRGPISLIPNGVPKAFSTASARTGVSAIPFVLSVGNLRSQKDYPTLIDAAAIVSARLGKDGTHVRFAIAGEGEERQRLEALVAERGLGERFELLGARSDVAQLMERADLLVNSSASEGLSIALIEAAMSGLPIVATDVGGNGEVVEAGSNGFLVPSGRPDLLADHICRVLSDRDLFTKCSAGSLALAQRFTLESCAEAHLALYREVLADDASSWRDRLPPASSGTFNRREA